MQSEILEIRPQELKFIFELKKQSSCSVRLINKSDQHVAFKVKTTSPKKYCVRPNTGVIEPTSTCDFTVTMQAQKVAPPDLICKDKFLVQSTVVPEGTEEEDITSFTFAKEDGKYVEEKKLRVTLVSPPSSPVLSPTNGTLKLAQNNEATELKDDDVQLNSSNTKVDEGMEASKGESEKVETTRNEESKRKDMEEVKLVKDLEEMKSRLKELESKLREAKATISNLTEERKLATQEKQMLQGELDVVTSKSQRKARAQVGFPFLFVCMVALVSCYIGYLLHR